MPPPDWPDAEGRPVAGAPTEELNSPTEPATEDTAASEPLAAIHGGERRAAHWLRRVLAEVPR
jgi:hypothetical protein